MLRRIVGTRFSPLLVVVFFVSAAVLFGVSRGLAWYHTAALVFTILFILFGLGSVLGIEMTMFTRVVSMLFFATLAISFFSIGFTQNPFDPVIILLTGIGISLLAGHVIARRKGETGIQ